MDTSVESLVSRAERYAHDQGLALSTVSFLVLNDGKRLEALKKGAGITVKRLGNANSRLTELEAQAAPAAESAA